MCKGLGGVCRKIDGGVEAAAQEEAVKCVAEAAVAPDDVAIIVDAGGERVLGGGSVERGVGAVAVKIAVVIARAVLVVTDDLTGIVDADCVSMKARSAQRIVDGCEVAVGVEVAVTEAMDVGKGSDDLTRVVDAGRGVSAHPQRIDDRRENLVAEEEEGVTNNRVAAAF